MKKIFKKKTIVGFSIFTFALLATFMCIDNSNAEGKPVNGLKEAIESGALAWAKTTVNPGGQTVVYCPMPGNTLCKR